MACARRRAAWEQARPRPLSRTLDREGGGCCRSSALWMRARCRSRRHDEDFCVNVFEGEVLLSSAARNWVSDKCKPKAVYRACDRLNVHRCSFIQESDSPGNEHFSKKHFLAANAGKSREILRSECSYRMKRYVCELILEIGRLGRKFKCTVHVGSCRNETVITSPAVSLSHCQTEPQTEPHVAIVL